jgi:hypothetical protein
MNKQHQIRWLASSVVIIYLISCAGPYEKDYPKDFTLQLLSKSDRVIKDEVVLISIDEIKTKHPDFNPLAFVVLEVNKELASQTNDQDMDGQQDYLAFICDFNANETKVCTVRYASNGEKKRSYVKRTQAELSHKTGGKFVDRKYEGGTFKNVTSLLVPPEHTDHSFYIRYEGPGWESDKVGMAILFHQSSLVELTEDEYNHVIVLKPDHNKVLYYFLAAWEKEPGGITNENEFVTYLQDTVDRLNTPIEMEIK